MSNVTLRVNMTPLRVCRSTANEELQTKKGWTVKKMIVEFTTRQLKWHMLFSFSRIIESTGFVKRLSGSERRRRSEWTDSNTNSINNLHVNCSQDGQPDHSFFEKKMFSVNFATFAFWKLLFCYDSCKNVAGIVAFQVVALPVASCQTKNI